MINLSWEAKTLEELDVQEHSGQWDVKDMLQLRFKKVTSLDFVVTDLVFKHLPSLCNKMSVVPVSDSSLQNTTTKSLSWSTEFVTIRYWVGFRTHT